MANVFRNLTDIGRVTRAARYALAGLKAAYIHEAAFRLEVVLFAVLAPLGAWLGRDGVERALLIGSLVLAPIAELMNSAIGTAVNRVGTERHELAGRGQGFRLGRRAPGHYIGINRLDFDSRGTFLK